MYNFAADAGHLGGGTALWLSFQATPPVRYTCWRGPSKAGEDRTKGRIALLSIPLSTHSPCLVSTRCVPGTRLIQGLRPTFGVLSYSFVWLWHSCDFQSTLSKSVTTWRSVWQLRSSTKPSLKRQTLKKKVQSFPGGSVVKNPPANAGDTGLIPDLGRSHMPRSN